ncbi:MAG: hypothetical protein ACP5I8_13255 [Phycisphaerae bacterium]
MSAAILEQIRQQIKTVLATVNVTTGSPVTLIVTADKREGVQPVNGTCIVTVAEDAPLEAAQNIARRKATIKVVTFTDFSESLEAIQDADTALIDLSSRIQMAVCPSETGSHLNGLAEGTWVGDVLFGNDADYYVVENEFTVDYRTLYFDPYVQG